MDLTVGVPGWFRGFPQVEREAVAKRFWAEGRLKLEPWLTLRLTNPPVSRHGAPRSRSAGKKTAKSTSGSPTERS